MILNALAPGLKVITRESQLLFFKYKFLVFLVTKIAGKHDPTVKK